MVTSLTDNFLECFATGKSGIPINLGKLHCLDGFMGCRSTRLIKVGWVNGDIFQICVMFVRKPAQRCSSEDEWRALIKPYMEGAAN